MLQLFHQMMTEMTTLHTNITDMSGQMSESKLTFVELKKHVDSVEYVTTTIRSDVAGLTTKIYNVKTSVFEQSNEMSTLKATQSHMQSAVDKMEMQLSEKHGNEKGMTQHFEDMKSDLFAMRTGLASLTNTVFTIKSQVELTGSIDNVIADLRTNVTLVRSELNHIAKDFSSVKPGKKI